MDFTTNQVLHTEISQDELFPIFSQQFSNFSGVYVHYLQQREVK